MSEDEIYQAFVIKLTGEDSQQVTDLEDAVSKVAHSKKDRLDVVLTKDNFNRLAPTIERAIGEGLSVQIKREIG
jgi:hypothetical protein